MSKHTDEEYAALYDKYVDVCSRLSESKAEAIKLKEELHLIHSALHWFPEVEDAKRKFNIPVIFKTAHEYAGHLRNIAQGTSQHIAALEELILVLRADITVGNYVDRYIHSLKVANRSCSNSAEAGYVLIKQKLMQSLVDSLISYAKNTDMRMMTQHSDSLFFAEILNIIRSK